MEDPENTEEPADEASPVALHSLTHDFVGKTISASFGINTGGNISVYMTGQAAAGGAPPTQNDTRDAVVAMLQKAIIAIQQI